MKTAQLLVLATLLLQINTAGAQAQTPAPAPTPPGWILDQNGCKIWNPSPVPGEKATWTGDCVDGMASGHGEQKWILTTGVDFTYVGTMREGKLSGSGVSISANGFRYEGQYLDGRRHGQGVLRWPDGTRYEGEFAGGYMHGPGVLQFPGGSRYEGQFEDGYMKGKMQVTWPSQISPVWLEDQINAFQEPALQPNQVRVRPVARITSKCTPQYPAYAARAEATGSTRVALLINRFGKVSKARIARTAGDTAAHKLLDFTTVAALWDCKFDAGTIDGTEVEMWISIDFVWKLE